MELILGLKVGGDACRAWISSTAHIAPLLALASSVCVSAKKSPEMQ